MIQQQYTSTYEQTGHVIKLLVVMTVALHIVVQCFFCDAE